MPLEEYTGDTSVLNSHVIIVYDFFAHWCGPCKKLAPLFVELSKEFPQFLFLKVEEGNEIPKFGDIRAYPTLMITKNCKVEYKSEGFDNTTIQELREKLKTFE